MERKQYIQNNDDKEALQIYLNRLGEPNRKVEEISPVDALGRVTAEVVIAKKCDPSYNAAAMDGIAVNAEKTLGASEKTPLTLKLNEDFIYINTGGSIKGEYNAVIMIEDVIIPDSGKVQIIAPAYPWQHIRVIGESVVAGEMVLPSMHRITPCDIGAVIASGNKRIKVFAVPSVGIIPTGGEMVDDPDLLEDGKLMESNSKVFAALTQTYGGSSKRYDAVNDDIDELSEAILKAVEENDMVIVNAGSSAGTKDFTVKAIERLGEVVIHGIAVKPGKPAILGIVQGKPVLGIPGYPVSAYLVFEMFAKPIILALAGREQLQKTFVNATLTRRLVSSFKNAELIRVALGEVNGKLKATPLERGASAVMSLVKADGILRIERLVEGLEAGKEVSVELLKPIDEIKRSLVIIGSHDIIIDIISDSLPVSSAHVGSMGGISALLREECHIAPIHLLDEKSGKYNVSFIKEYFSDRKMALIKGVGRVQGLLVPEGNPKGITGLQDIVSKKLMYANRQRGAGTRLLLDYELKKIGASPKNILGYEKEYSTHLAVAVAVKNGAADCGMAVLSAAKAVGTEFIPVGNEEYDFLVPYEYLNDERVKRFLEIISSEKFKRELDKLGGYTYEHIGELEIFEL